jgi:hypothetical protein
MTLTEFKALNDSSALPLPLQALARARQGDWAGAHELAQQANDRDGDWVHAYLHREEGDAANARYWYTRAGRTMPAIPLATEWEGIAAELLAR